MLCVEVTYTSLTLWDLPFGQIPLTPFGRQKEAASFTTNFTDSGSALRSDPAHSIRKTKESKLSFVLPHYVRGSSKGRTAAFEAVNLGSIPSPRTKTMPPARVVLFWFENVGAII